MNTKPGCGTYLRDHSSLRRSTRFFSRLNSKANWLSSLRSFWRAALYALTRRRYKTSRVSLYCILARQDVVRNLPNSGHMVTRSRRAPGPRCILEAETAASSVHALRMNSGGPNGEAESPAAAVERIKAAGVEVEETTAACAVRARGPPVAVAAYGVHSAIPVVAITRRGEVRTFVRRPLAARRSGRLHPNTP